MGDGEREASDDNGERLDTDAGVRGGTWRTTGEIEGLFAHSAENPGEGNRRWNGVSGDETDGLRLKENGNDAAVALGGSGRSGDKIGDAEDVDERKASESEDVDDDAVRRYDVW